MKKSNRPTYEKESDRVRLMALTKDSYDDIWSFDGKTLPENVCRYALGIYYEINPSRRTIDLEYQVEAIIAMENASVLNGVMR